MTDIVVVLSVLALISALVLLTLPVSGRYFRSRPDRHKPARSDVSTIDCGRS